jgi:hypothetical protein
MNRSILTVAVITLLGAAACDKSATEAQENVNKAQAKANTEITSAQVTLDERAKNAQAEADKKIAQVQAEFAKTREDYRHVMQSNLDSIDKKLAGLDAKVKTTTGAAATDLAATATTLRSQRDAFANDFKNLDFVIVSSWDATKTRVDKEWADLSAAVDKAF